MEDLKILIPEDKFLQIGKKKFKIWISAERALKATALFNKLNVPDSEERKAVLTDLDFYNAMLDVAFLLIKQDFRIKNLFDWIRREMLTKKYILKNLDIKELEEFVNNALEPIIGTKKKVMEKQTKMEDIMIQIVDTVGIEAFTQLLLNLSQGPDIKKVM